MTFAPGDRITVTMPRSPSREGEYVEDRGTRCRVLLDGEHVTRVVLRERVRPVKVRAWVSERVVSGVMLHDATLVEIPPHLEVTAIDHETRTISVGLRAVPKPPKPARDATYLKFVRRQMCCSCNASGPCEAHHFGPRGMSQKADDWHVVPLCTSCHRLFHDKGEILGRDRKATEERFAFIKVGLLTSWIRQKWTDVAVVDALVAHLKESQT